MTVERAWSPVVAELDLWVASGQQARLWLRDDDAETISIPLERLLELIKAFDVPCLLAVIPMRAQNGLQKALAGNGLITAAVHGAWHANHEPAGRKAAETPVARGMPVIAQELLVARLRVIEMFGAVAGIWYVPPWNRIDADIAALLPELGFSALSTFGGVVFPHKPGFQQHNTHVDIMDWKNGRVGRDAPAVAADLAAALAAARLDGFRPVGILTHHLVHDATAWQTLETLMTLIRQHPAARWIAPAALLQKPPRW
jgi:hypothetical protein